MEDTAQKIALFFYYAFLDERRALEASGHVYQKLLRQVVDYQHFSNPQRHAAIVNYTFDYWKKNKNKALYFLGDLPKGPLWNPPQGILLGPWRELLKQSAGQDYPIYLIWIYILGFNEREVAMGLGVSEGSIRFRVGRSLRSLGNLVPLLKSEAGATI